MINYKIMGFNSLITAEILNTIIIVYLSALLQQNTEHIRSQYQ